jgi:23S rRNA (guanosine2251-2'-O)-methyltransferase
VIPFLYDQGVSPLILVLDRITDVRNFGAICRSSACAGVHAIVFPEKGSAAINEVAVKTSAGAIHHINICRSDNLSRTLEFLKNSGLKLIGVSERAKKSCYLEELTGPIGLVLGSEEDGISPELLKACDDTVQIPMAGKIASLNVSVAAAIVMFEALRQRTLN